eukprot:scaffold10838_cov99-Isochrysis_galbana.AAC.4
MRSSGAVPGLLRRRCLRHPPPIPAHPPLPSRYHPTRRRPPSRHARNPNQPPPRPRPPPVHRSPPPASPRRYPRRTAHRSSPLPQKKPPRRPKKNTPSRLRPEPPRSTHARRRDGRTALQLARRRPYLPQARRNGTEAPHHLEWFWAPLGRRRWARTARRQKRRRGRPCDTPWVSPARPAPAQPPERLDRCSQRGGRRD